MNRIFSHVMYASLNLIFNVSHILIFTNTNKNALSHEVIPTTKKNIVHCSTDEDLCK